MALCTARVSPHASTGTPSTPSAVLRADAACAYAPILALHVISVVLQDLLLAWLASTATPLALRATSSAFRLTPSPIGSSLHVPFAAWLPPSRRCLRLSRRCMGTGAHRLHPGFGCAPRRRHRGGLRPGVRAHPGVVCGHRPAGRVPGGDVQAPHGCARSHSRCARRHRDATHVQRGRARGRRDVGRVRQGLRFLQRASRSAQQGWRSFRLASLLLPVLESRDAHADHEGKFRL